MAKKTAILKTAAEIEIQIGDLAQVEFNGETLIGTVSEFGPAGALVKLQFSEGRIGYVPPSAIVIMEWSHGHGLNSRHGPDCPKSPNVIREHWPFRDAKYVAIGMTDANFYWGRGFTREEAIAGMKAQGFRWTAKGARGCTYKIPEGAENPDVDFDGTVLWTWAEGADTSAKPTHEEL